MPSKNHNNKKNDKSDKNNLYFSNPDVDIIYVDMETITDKKNAPIRHTRY